MTRTVLRSVVCAFALTAFAASPAAAKTDYAAPGLAWNVLAPGEHGGLLPDALNVDQGKMYDALTPLRGNVSLSQVQGGNYFKSEAFELTPGPGETKRMGLAGHSGVTWWTDAHGVPHIIGKTRADSAFAIGYFAGQDRNLLINNGRGPSYVSALSVPGINAFGLITSTTKFTPSQATRDWMTAQVNTFKNANAGNMQVYNDFVAYVAGINAYYASHTSDGPADWTVNDAFAAFSFIGSIFGNGGGDEVGNSNLLAKLQAQYGNAKGLAIFRDFRHSNDLDAPVSWKDSSFPYNVQPTNTLTTAIPASKVIDVNSASDTVGRAAVEAGKGPDKRYMSNAQLVPSSRSATGHPLAVMGPQLGYYHPEIVMEVDVHGGGFDFRGAVAPVAPYGLIGRGKDYAWSLTSASSDNTDQFLEQLCVPGGGTPTRTSTSYLYNGTCRAMTTTDAGLLASSSRYGAAHEVYFKESVHGPISGTVTIDGAPYAVANARANRGREPWSARALADLSTNQVTSSASFFKVANEFETTFNWHYVDSKNICFFSSGRLPVRATGLDSSLPTLGTGAYDWTGFISQNTHPHGCNPKAVAGDNASAIITNWNNHPAKGWGAADDEWGYASSHRMGLFQRDFRLNHPSGKRLKLNDVVSVMNRVATQDVSAVDGWPNVKRMLLSDGNTLTGVSPNADTTALVNAIDDWITNQDASRLDSTLDSKFDFPGVVAWGTAWPRIVDAVMGGGLTQSLANDLLNKAGRGDKTNQGAGTGMVRKDLGTLLGDTFKSPTSMNYCGRGSTGSAGRTACRAAIWTALQAAAAQVVTDTGTSVSPTWLTTTGNNPLAQRIHFAPLNPTDPATGQEFTMRWTNRPTFQQAISFSSHR